MLRRIERGDSPALAALWHRTFGDSEDYALRFLSLLEKLGFGYAAVEDGAVVGMAYLIDDLALSTGQRVGYLYAVAVDERCRRRGLGAALCRACAEDGRREGRVIATLPASEPLRTWYRTIIGTRHDLYRGWETLRAGGELPVRSLGAAAYGAERERLLSGRPHLCLGQTALEAEALNCHSFGGGLYAVGGCLCAASFDEGILTVRECLGPDRALAAAALGAALGCESVRLMSVGGDEPYMALDKALPPDTVWNLAFD